MSDTTPSRHDCQSRFLIEQAGVRGVHVHLRDSWQRIVGQDDYPAAVAELLGEATAAAALFTGHAKVDGRLSVQLRGNGALRTLFAECTAAGTLRGIAQVAEGAQPSRDLRELGPDALLAITIENPALGQREPMRYQGMVELSADNLAGAFEDYFIQSEQLPTRLMLAVDGERAAGLMLQKLPGDEGDSDGWTRAGALFDTVVTDELLTLPAETLLARLFHEDGVRMLGQRPLAFACSCSAERVESMLVSLGEAEAHAAAADGEAHIRCEFCGQQYRFSRDEIDRLFATRSASMEAPDRAQ
ncbi:Hsp33 family molecular chaperone HslO [Marilutibacter aestuarii]|uniref:Hsp33 family molecular chaperone HslO n=1 Tax=Marilutibacter aestuarii TaxID=1706195 RepID=A0A508AP24_9GAMM|nr:Hsp33 family molecular chaperone HslO [Lysobacter aestuarii]TQD48895.1 Hsp33 family molecular chaperone HslO [Lysobacter aestuarii]